MHTYNKKQKGTRSKMNLIMNRSSRRHSQTPLLLSSRAAAALGFCEALEMSPPPSQEFCKVVTVADDMKINLLAIYGSPSSWNDDDDSNNASQQQMDDETSLSTLSHPTQSSPLTDTNLSKTKSSSKQQGEGGSSYWSLLRYNGPFCLFLASYITNHLGEWLTYIAALTAIEEIQRSLQLAEEEQQSLDSATETALVSTSQTAIGILVVVRLLSTVIISPFGGVLADCCDRRRSMIILDLMGAVAAFGYVLAVQLQSIPCIYIAGCLQQVLTGLYEPSRSAIVPLLVPDNSNELEKATILTSVAWSIVAAFGSASGGFLVALFGTRGCFVIDSATYIISALLMALVPGNFNVSLTQQETTDTTCASSSSSRNSASSPFKNDDVTESSSSFSLSLLVSTISSMLFDGVQYLCTSFFGALVFFKFTVMWFTMDVVIVSFAKRHATVAAIAAAAAVAAANVDGQDDATFALQQAVQAAREPIYLGFLFCAIGVGSLLGPVVTEHFTDMNRPITLQVACLLSIALSSLTCLIMSIPGIPFWLLCFLMGTRALGVSTSWIDSTLLLQKFVAPDMLGRVMSLDFALALMAESSSAMLAGRVQDAWGWTPEQVCRGLGMLGCIQLLIWLIYHVRGGGAASAVAANPTQAIATAVLIGKYIDNDDDSDSEQAAFLPFENNDDDEQRENGVYTYLQV